MIDLVKQEREWKCLYLYHYNKSCKYFNVTQKGMNLPGKPYSGVTVYLALPKLGYADQKIRD